MFFASLFEDAIKKVVFSAHFPVWMNLMFIVAYSYVKNIDEGGHYRSFLWLVISVVRVLGCTAA